MAVKMQQGKEKERGQALMMEPMIDCVFLLLIFFMVSAIMRVPPPFTVTLPESATKHDFPRKKFNLFVSADGRISFDDLEMITLEHMEMYLSSKEAQITTLIIKADRLAKHGRVIDVMERAKRRFSKTEGQEIALMVSEETFGR
jgi:biopolymer transport protein ExbD